MLEIFIKGKSIDLPTDIQINLTIENPFIKEDRIPLPYSLTFSLPATVKNIGLFNYPDRISGQFNSSEFDCFMLFNGLNIATGVLTMTRFDKNIEVSFRGVEVTDNLQKKMHKTNFESYYLGDSLLSPLPIDFDSGIGRVYKNLMQGAVDTDNEKFALAPVRAKNEEWVIRKRGSSNTGVPETSADNMYFNYFNAKDKSWLFTSATRTIHASNYPYPYVHYLIDTIFGDTLSDNPFLEGDLKKLVALTTFHPAWKRKGTGIISAITRGLQNDYREFTPLNKFYIFLDTRLPDLGTKDFVKELAKIFGYTLVALQGKFYFKTNADILNSTTKRNWSNKLVGKKSISKELAKQLSYGYEGDSSTETDTNGLPVVNSYNQVYSYESSPNAPEGAEDMIYVSSTDEVFLKRATSEVNYGFERKSSGFGSLEIAENSYNLVSKVKPLELSIEYYWNEQTLPTGTEYPVFSYWVVPLFMEDRERRADFSNIMFYHGLQDTFHFNHQAPYLSPHQVDPFGNQLGDLSLYWGGDRGLLNNFHMDLKSWVEKDKLKISSAVQLQALDLHQMDITDKVHIDGKDFFIEKIQITLRKNRMDSAQVDFIEA